MSNTETNNEREARRARRLHEQSLTLAGQAQDALAALGSALSRADENDAELEELTELLDRLGEMANRLRRR